MPSTSAFARLFQFGMRLGMRSWTIGSAWWQADCGPYWGHNAVIRIAPFKQHCAIPPVPGRGLLRGPVLSHDQIEAALMRRAGYRRARPAGGGSRLGGEPADAARVHPARPALAAGHAAIRLLHRPARAEAGQPLPARLRHADVHRLAGLDRAAGAGHLRPGDARPTTQRRHRSGLRHRAARDRSVHVVLRQDR